MATVSTLYTFTNTGPAQIPFGGLLVDAAGDLFGTTTSGGVGGRGILFELVNNGDGSYTFSTLVSFNGGDGAYPEGTLIADTAGDLFDTTYGGGTTNSDGTVFEILKTSTGYASTPITLVNFDGSNGAGPIAGLTADAAGNLFGTTAFGGAGGGGTVFEIPKNNAGYGALITLASFIGGNGLYPSGTLITDTAGDLFGTAQNGGANGDGTVFELVKNGGSYSFSTLVNFNYTNGAAVCAAMNDWSDEKTDDPHYADRRNFYKVEKWSPAAGRICLACILERAVSVGERRVWITKHP
jgi:uncharacterized repeat protein (TIGR03803 family)